MDGQFCRTELIVGSSALEKLHSSKVAVFGVGGVGSFVVEGLSRAGVGNFVLIDNDVVDLSNLNRQIIATHSSIGRAKVDVAKERILDINPDCDVITFKEFFLPESDDFIDESVDYVVDCVDTVTAKLELVVRAKNKGIPIISAMGTGNKLDPTRLEVTDIYNTSVCPLAKVMRRELKSRNIDGLKVVYSKEEPIKCDALNKENRVPGSVSFVPSVAGMIIAGEVFKDLIKKD